MSSAQLRHAVAVLVLALIWLCMLLFGGDGPDRQIYEALYAGRHPALILAARALTFFGEPTVLIGAGFVVAALLWSRKDGRFALSLLFVILLGRALSDVQKYWVARARPTLDPHLVAVKTSSFPSGHATSSMIFYLTLALALAPPDWRRVAAASAILLSLMIGTSRVMLGVHWPSDVIGGWSFGLLWVLLTLPAAERILTKDSSRAQKQL